MTSTAGEMTVDIKNGKSITGRGTLNSDITGEVYFDYGGKPYPSSLDWKKATSLTFTPDVGKKTKNYHADSTEYFFQGGWVGPRLILQRAHRQ